MKHAIRHIHFVGIGGAGMSGIAEILHNLGYTVSGSDQHDSATTRRLVELGVRVFVGHAAAQIGTTGVISPSRNDYGSLTTPDPLALHTLLGELADEGVTHAAMEASSHGLEQHRLDGVDLSAVAFLNLTQDHLDYHHTMEAYAEAKAGLFSRLLPEDGAAVINLNGAGGAAMADLCAARGIRTLTIGHEAGADLRIRGQRYDATGQDLRFDWQGQPYQVHLNLVGGFQAENVLVAAGLVLLVLGSGWLVDSAVQLATAWGVSEAVIGLTIVAIGTSMPEMVTSIVAAIKGERDIAVGNVVGSNIFNILCVLGLSGLVSPVPLLAGAQMAALDIPVMSVINSLRQ